MRIGPEPTTDGFIAVMYGENEGVVPGNALVVDPKKPFRKLNAFGNSFLNRYTHTHTHTHTHRQTHSHTHDEYRLAPPAGLESYFLSRRR